MDAGTASSRAKPETMIAGRYEVQDVLGVGGMGAVYAVIDRTTHQLLALKRLTASAKPSIARLFEREYRTLAGLRHPCIVEVYDYGLDEQGAYYTMELLAGADLSGAAPMPWREVCACLRDAASILGLLHARQLIHRDLNPRNLWRTPEGRIKLIDFGALSPFGIGEQIVGTPPFVPPEALHGRALDQRADLYALGALGYWLLSGAHAYPAKAFAELPALWTHAPLPLRVLGRLSRSETLMQTPEALEATLSALLRLDADERLASTEELIDRLSTIADLVPESDAAAVSGYLHSQAFVGRERERRQFMDDVLVRVQKGQVCALFVEGQSGVGRTRLLEDYAVTAQLWGIIPLRVAGSDGARPYAVVSALAEKLLATCPVEAEAAAAPYADVLGHLSAALRERFGRPASLVGDAREVRLKLQSALQAWLLEVGRRRPLVVLVDDFHVADEESQAAFAVLAHAQDEARLGVVASVLRDERSGLSALAQNLRARAMRIHLAPLGRAETGELLRSVFGRAPFLQRLTERLHRISQGNPAHCLELAQYLVRSGHAKYVDGAWSLPRELSEARLPRSRVEGILLRLDRLAGDVRALGRLLSVPHHGPLSGALCQAVSPYGHAATEAALAALVREGVLAQAPAGYGFVHEALRECLYAELAAPKLVEAHRRLADAILAAAPDDHLEWLRASVHWLRAGDVQRAEPLVRDAARHFNDHGAETIRVAAPMMEEAVRLLRAAGGDQHALALPLGVLCCAGYFVDRRYAARYGMEALSVLQSVLRLDLAQRLRPFVGKKLALVVAFAAAGLSSLRRRRYAPRPVDVVRTFLASVTSLAGVAAVCLDGDTGDRCAQLVEPLTALGRYHAATVVRSLCAALALRSRDRIAEASRQQRALCALLSGPTPIRDLPEHARQSCLAGALLSLGVAECWRDGQVGLQIADQLVSFGPLYEMSADRIRAGYHASRGNLVEAARYQQRVEVHAIKLGSAWQVETWAPAESLKHAVMTHDALATKRAAQELTQLATELPSLSHYAASARGAYLILRNKPRQAVEVLEPEVPPLSVVGWSRMRALLARALNALGEHARAREVCRDALSRLDPEDLDYAPMTLSGQIELVHAEAGLGHFDQARALLEGLIARYAAHHGPLVASALHEAQVTLALAEGDLTLAGEALARLDACCREMAISSLLERVAGLRRRLDNVEGPDALLPEALAALPEGPQLMTRVQQLLSQGSSLLEERVRRGIQVAIELSGADTGFVVLSGQPGAAGHLGAAPPGEELTAWAYQRLLTACAEDETAAIEQVEILIDLNLKLVDRTHYCVTPLWGRRGDSDIVVGALALGFEKRAPRLPSAGVLRAIACHLVEDPSEARTSVGRKGKAS